MPTAAEDRHRLLAGLGPEPLEAGFSAAVLSAALAGKRTAIKAALLDQGVVAGLGNIYVCEALFRAGISPFRVAATVPGVRAERLVSAIRATLTEAIAAGGSSLRDYVAAEWGAGVFPARVEGVRAGGGGVRAVSGGALRGDTAGGAGGAEYVLLREDAEVRRARST